MCSVAIIMVMHCLWNVTMTIMRFIIMCKVLMIIRGEFQSVSMTAVRSVIMTKAIVSCTCGL